MKRLLILLLLFLTSVIYAQSPRERTLLNQDWNFAKGHPDPKLDFYYGRALSFSEIAFIQESTMLELEVE